MRNGLDHYWTKCGPVHCDVNAKAPQFGYGGSAYSRFVLYTTLGKSQLLLYNTMSSTEKLTTSIQTDTAFADNTVPQLREGHPEKLFEKTGSLYTSPTLQHCSHLAHSLSTGEANESHTVCSKAGPKKVLEIRESLYTSPTDQHCAHLSYSLSTGEMDESHTICPHKSDTSK
ncbi:hypothetical protein CPB86DRAFT_786944 [Serendipita vermifera]|nr:hypothetical protein CPB86DRAFT_786944 [Serendipita vermifera]